MPDDIAPNHPRRCKVASGVLEESGEDHRLNPQLPSNRRVVITHHEFDGAVSMVDLLEQSWLHRIKNGVSFREVAGRWFASTSR